VACVWPFTVAATEKYNDLKEGKSATGMVMELDDGE
jgi:hypothetical protein